MDQCSEWYTRKRSRLLVFWVAANLFLVAVAYWLNWRFGVGCLDCGCSIGIHSW
jgi:hypothetical protein